jgi:hypothetical protein
MNEENLVEKFINCLVSDEDKSAEFGNKADDFKEFKDKNKLLLDFLKDKNYYEFISLMTEVYVCDACNKIIYKNKENENLNMEGHNREKIIRKIDLPVVIKSNDQNLIEKIEEFLKGFEDFLNELEQKKKQEIQKMREVMQKIRSLLGSNNIYNSKWVIVISQNPNPIKDKEKYKYDSFEYNDKFQIGSVFGLGHLIYDLKNSEERKIPEVLGLLIMLGLWPKYNLYFTDAVKCFYEKKLGQRIIKNCWDKVLSKEIKEIIKKFSGVEKILLFGDVAKNNYERIKKEIKINKENIICLPHPQGQGTPYYSNTISIINELKEKFGFKKIEDKIDGFWILKQKISPPKGGNDYD